MLLEKIKGLKKYDLDLMPLVAYFSELGKDKGMTLMIDL